MRLRRLPSAANRKHWGQRPQLQARDVEAVSSSGRARMNGKSIVDAGRASVAEDQRAEHDAFHSSSSVGERNGGTAPPAVPSADTGDDLVDRRDERQLPTRSTGDIKQNIRPRGFRGCRRDPAEVTAARWPLPCPSGRRSGDLVRPRADPCRRDRPIGVRRTGPSLVPATATRSTLLSAEGTRAVAASIRPVGGPRVDHCVPPTGRRGSRTGCRRLRRADHGARREAVTPSSRWSSQATTPVASANASTRPSSAPT